MLIKNNNKYLLALLGIVFAAFVYFYDSNNVEALTCTYSPAQTPSQYYCYNSGTCAITDDANVACSTGEWVNCREVTGEDGSSQRLCWCSGTCTVVGRTVSGSACGVSNTCSYNFGNNCNVPGTGGCSRVMTYPSSGDGENGNSVTTETCPSGIFDISRSGGASMTVYAGDSTALGYNVTAGPNKSMVNIATEVVGCPNGANCSAKQVRTVYASDGAMYGAVTVSPVSTAPGTYTVSVKAYENENPSCIRVVDYSVTVKPSRRMVCDGGWYEVPPGSIPYNTVNSGPVVRFNNGASNFEKYFKASFNGRQLTSPSTWGSRDFSLNCRYTSGMSSTCTWDLPDYTMPFDTIKSWSPNSGTMGATASAIDTNTPNNRTVTLRRTGNKFEYSCSSVTTPTATCDGSWRYLPQGGATPAQPVGIYVGSSLDTQYRDAVVIAARESGPPSGSTATLTACRFNGTNICTWDSSWYNSQGGTTAYAPNLSLGSALDFNIKTIWANGFWVKNVNKNSTNPKWSGWVSQGVDNGVNWGQPFRARDKLGRYWQFRSINGSVAYACGATPVCVTLNYDSSKSSISKTNLTSGEAFTVKCDYGVRGITDAMGVTTNGGASCAFSSWDNGNNNRTTANFNCTAGNVGGTFPVSCVNSAGTSSNVCSQSNSLGNITVTAPALPTVTISANPMTIPYNTASTLSWSYSNASSCTITPPGSISGYPNRNGSVSTGNLTSTRNYTLSCQNSSGITASDSVTVTVQAQINNQTLNVVRSGQGTVTSNPAGINCGSTCSASYPENTTVVLTAVPASGRVFTGWGGACSGKGSCSVLMNVGKTVLANFAVDPNFKEF